MVIQSFQLADYAGVSRLLTSILPAECFEETRRAFVNQLSLDHHLILVASKNGEMMGVVIGTIAQHRGIIYRVVVKPIYRHQGIGTSLLHTLHARFTLRQITEIVVAIDTYNVSIMSFFESVGFKDKTIITSIDSR
ncbi:MULTISPECIES: GNAT family N-acetyltransferase [unclassified Brevibacillus]|uniref:GNAT family N-acetyltransferase n=1 Tax=Brevibacillus TaxID=55080 RepID=UPI0030D628D6